MSNAWAIVSVRQHERGLPPRVGLDVYPDYFDAVDAFIADAREQWDLDNRNVRDGDEVHPRPDTLRSATSYLEWSLGLDNTRHLVRVREHAPALQEGVNQP